MGWRGKKIGKFLLKEKLGEGGMGLVFLAVQEGLEREVALKVLPESKLERSPDLAKRFLREASVCARLSHPNIIRVYDFGSEQGLYYYAMEVLRTESLEERLKEQPVQPVEFALRVATDLVEAMRCYMPAGIVHRDIKPANVMLDEQGKAILTDFGLVKDLGATNITRTGAAVGTPYYMSPEMVKGQVVPASDFWQLGVLLYRMLTGLFPFDGATSAEVFVKILQDEAEPASTHNPKLPVPVDNLLRNLLEKDLAVRYSDVEELAEDVAAAARRARVPLRREGGGAGRSRASASLEAGAGEVPGRPSHPEGPERRRATRATRSPNRAVQPVPPTVRSVPRGTSPETLARVLRLLAVVMLVPLAFAAYWLRNAAGDYGAVDVRRGEGLSRAVVEWESPRAYPTRLEWGDAEGGAKRVAGDGAEERLQHRVVLEPLESGRRYVFRILFPDGKTSLDRELRAQDSKLPAPRLTVAAGRLSLAFETPGPLVAELEAGGSKSRDPEPVRQHRLELEGIDPASAPLVLRYHDAAGDPIVLDREGILAAYRQARLEPDARQLIGELAAFDPAEILDREVDQRLTERVCKGASSAVEQVGFDGLLTGANVKILPHYVHFPPGDPEAAELAGRLSEALEARPFMQTLRLMRLVAPDVLDSRRLPPQLALELHRQLRKLRHVDHYARTIGIGFSTGVDRLFAVDGRMSYARVLPSGAPSAVLSTPAGVSWTHPVKEARIIATQVWQDRTRVPIDQHEWTVELDHPERWRRAEAALVDVRVYHELGFELTFNDAYTLDLRPDPDLELKGQAVKPPAIATTFDPRQLRHGKNRVHLKLGATPGTRDLGLKRSNDVRRVVIAWEE